MSIVQIKEVSKSYAKGTVKAVDNISLNIEEGELFGLIGPDGAGKTSLFRMLTTLLLPDNGNITVFGNDTKTHYKEIRRHVGYMPGKFSLYQDLTVEENLDFFATLFNTDIKTNYDLIKDIYVQLEPFKNRRAGKLSGGMKQKLALCCALIHKPKVLFLDEPTTGVDTVSRKEFWEMLQQLKKQQITIMVSTPYMDEAVLCERIALIQQGTIMSVDTPKNITDKYPKPLYAIRTSNMSLLLKDLRQSQWVSTCYAFGEYHHITFNTEDLYVAQTSLIQELQLKDAHYDIQLDSIQPTIEDCFIHLMN